MPVGVRPWAEVDGKTAAVRVGDDGVAEQVDPVMVATADQGAVGDISGAASAQWASFTSR